MDYSTSPNKGEYVKLLFSNGIVETGIVLYWSDEKSVIMSGDTNNRLIIHNTLQNILAVQVSAKQPDKPAAPNEVFIDKELKPDKYYKDEKLRALSLADLHKAKAAEERKRAREALTKFQPTGEVKALYAEKRTTIPRGWNQKPIQFNPSEENIRSY